MTESMISRLERGDHVPSLKTLCRIADAFGRHLEIVFHEHGHVHADGTRHIHPHSHTTPSPSTITKARHELRTGVAAGRHRRYGWRAAYHRPRSLGADRADRPAT